ncbi:MULTISPECIES: DUF2235 domain-containing protein [unclassified Bradyrhizobium]|uniref:DUF2235 domain-containing protein n=1 Tax=unclassified Bradyrhizobium TaxID=2631580 RepID=UPI0023061561|nr:MULTISPECIES: DUF2235 domain-containing protein [unclassified Bradyrhizobium]
MTKRIVLLSDGTGNAAGKVWKSNVWRIFESLDLRSNDQVAFYDDGVGTSSFKPLAILGGAFGWGLKRNVLDIYKFLCANYEEGDRVYAFGFSRGAFTMRVVLGLALNQGLVKGATDAELYENAKMAYRAYRAERFHTFLHVERPLRKLRDLLLAASGKRYRKENNRELEAVEFVGLWDTVAAYGLPVDEMARGVSQYIWPLELPNRDFNDKIRCACHALSLDDERTTFHPVLWNEKDVPPGRLKQVWFSGVHSNVGGGYPDDSLAYIPLYWIMKEAQGHGLNFKTVPNQPTNPDPDMMAFAEWHRDKDGRLYDSRNGLGGYYRYGPRRIEDLSRVRFSWRKGDRVENGPPTIHETAILRARQGAHRYAPIGIPEDYQVLSDGGVGPRSMIETDDQAKARHAKQEEIWNDVWRRRIVYFITVFASLYLAVYPLSRTIGSSGEFDSGWSLVSGLVRAVGQVLPGALTIWVDAYARDPGHFLLVGALVALLIWLGVRLGRRISDRMERVWRSGPEAPRSKLGAWLGIPAAITALYLALHVHLPPPLRLPKGGEQFLDRHVGTSLKIIALATVVALFTPAGLVYHLRSWGGYRALVRWTKLFVLPLFFAASFLLLGVLFISHLAFSIEEANGWACEQSDSITRAIAIDELGEHGKTVENHGLQACISPGLATCTVPGARPSCSNGREVFCGEGQPVCGGSLASPVPVCSVPAPADRSKPASSHVAGLAVCPAICEKEPIASEARRFDIGEVCHKTGIWLEQGQRYEITLIAPSPGDDDYAATAWRDADGSVVSTRGTASTEPWAKLREVLIWPLKRHLFVERFKVVARVGSIGSDETILEADDPKSNVLNVVIVPKRPGELFLYVNEAVWGLPWLYDRFYRNDKGHATLVVQRPRQPN